MVDFTVPPRGDISLKLEHAFSTMHEGFVFDETNTIDLAEDTLTDPPNDNWQSYIINHSGDSIGGLQLEQQEAGLYVVRDIIIGPESMHWDFDLLDRDYHREGLGTRTYLRIIASCIENGAGLRNHMYSNSPASVKIWRRLVAAKIAQMHAEFTDDYNTEEAMKILELVGVDKAPPEPAMIGHCGVSKDLNLDLLPGADTISL